MVRFDSTMEFEREDDWSWSGNGSQWNNDYVTEIFKDSDLYLATKNGKLDEFKRVVDRVSAAECASLDDILCRLSPAKNTYLHVATKHGNEDIVNFLATKKPSLVLSKNFNGETALHLAARAGDASMVKALVQIHQDSLVLEPLPQNEGNENNNLLRAKNKRGNTALHEALLNARYSIAEYLIQEDPELSYHQNKDGESALYLAAKAGHKNCLSLIFQLSTDQERVSQLFRKKSPIQAAIKGKHREVLEAMVTMNPSITQSRDGEGRTPLHYAASLGYLEDVRYLLNQYAQSATQGDRNGSFPIHLASIEGHVDVIRLLLQDFPDPGEVLDRDGRNILHLAAKNRRSNVVHFVLKNPDLKDLINMKDKQGNTPLHLATMHWHPMIVSALTWDKRVDIKFVNDKGMTALDVAECHMLKRNRPNIQWLTWVALRAAGTPRSLFDKTIVPKKTCSIAIFKEEANFRLIVSTLVATVTFAAGFTVPGGYNSSESNSDPGMATMLRDRAFQIFVLCDIIAMYSSISVAVVLSWAQSVDFNLVVNAINFTLPLFWISLTMMSMAFTAGLFLVVSKLRWLSAAVLIMGITFHLLLLLYCLVISMPLISSNRVLRYLSYYPFCLLVLVNSGQSAGQPTH